MSCHVGGENFFVLCCLISVPDECTEAKLTFSIQFLSSKACHCADLALQCKLVDMLDSMPETLYVAGLNINALICLFGSLLLKQYYCRNAAGRDLLQRFTKSCVCMHAFAEAK